MGSINPCTVLRSFYCTGNVMLMRKQLSATAWVIWLCTYVKYMYMYVLAIPWSWCTCSVFLQFILQFSFGVFVAHMVLKNVSTSNACQAMFCSPQLPTATTWLVWSWHLKGYKYFTSSSAVKTLTRLSGPKVSDGYAMLMKPNKVENSYNPCLPLPGCNGCVHLRIELK